MSRPKSEDGPSPTSLTLVTVQILASLGRRPMHGYGIKLDIEERTDGAVSLGSGTLYQALKRLEKQGLVSSFESDDEDGRRGRHYALEPLGQKILDRELAQMQRMLTWAADEVRGTESPA